MKEWLNLQHAMWEEEGEVVNTRGVLKSFINKCNENDVYFESFEQK